MCTLALFFHFLDGFPLLVAANRDEHYDRATVSPHLVATEPKVLAGKDLRAGGTWLGVNEHGLIAAILNRRADGPEASATAGTRSRGLLCLDVLRIERARYVPDFLRARKETYNPFTLVYADLESAGVAFNKKDKISVGELGDGLHVFSSAAEIDARAHKAERARGRFSNWASSFQPMRENLDTWEGLLGILGDHTFPDGGDSRDAICVHGDQSGTVSSSIIYYAAAKRQFHSHYCGGAPCRNTFSEHLTLKL